MKSLYLLLFLLPSSICGQELNLPKNSQGLVEYTGVVQIDSVSEKDILSRAKLFVANAFVSYKDVVQLIDDNTNTIVVRGLIPIDAAIGSGGWKIKMTLQCKSGRFKYSFTEFFHDYKLPTHSISGGAIENDKPQCGTFHLPKKAWTQLKENLDRQVLALIKDMSRQMAQSNSDNW
jgi:hypothetical protein